MRMEDRSRRKHTLSFGAEQRQRILSTLRPGRTEAERNCISNIRPEGLSYARAGSELAYILNEARRLRLTGVALKAEARQLGSVSWH